MATSHYYLICYRTGFIHFPRSMAKHSQPRMILHSTITAPSRHPFHSTSFQNEHFLTVPYSKSQKSTKIRNVNVNVVLNLECLRGSGRRRGSSRTAGWIETGDRHIDIALYWDSEWIQLSFIGQNGSKYSIIVDRNKME